ncbi:MAG TPA: hypothetical protein VIH68_01115 [Bacteroidota bacterium]
MNWHTISLPLIVVSILLYHLSQKSIPVGANPLIAIATAYVVALSLCLGVLLATGDIMNSAELLRNQSWVPAVLLGVAAMGIELGFLYAYRTGWRFSTTAITTGSFVMVALALIGVLWYKEELSALNVAGIGLCALGVVCINLK